MLKENKDKKRKPQFPIYIDSDGDNERPKKRHKAKLGMAEAVYKGKKIDAEIQKREQELRRELAEKTKNKTVCRHELVMAEVKEQRIELQTQAIIR